MTTRAGLGGGRIEDLGDVYHFQVRGRKLFEKRARRARHRAAVLRAVDAVRHRQPPPRAGDADVEQAAFFVDGALHARTLVRQRPLLHPHEEDERELQPLCRVQGDERDLRSGLLALFLLLLLPVAVERDTVHKPA